MGFEPVDNIILYEGTHVFVQWTVRCGRTYQIQQRFSFQIYQLWPRYIDNRPVFDSSSHQKCRKTFVVTKSQKCNMSSQ
eukprot:scaffold5382_cov34-Cylindrotheca_fusiformis.AAC.1